MSNIVDKNLINIATDKWNEDLPYISSCISKSNNKNALFYWELVWQKIVMYINIGEKIEKGDLDFIIKRRGFDIKMSTYLKEMLNYLELY